MGEDNDKSYRVLRGGSLYNDERDTQVAYRYGGITSFRYDHLGFRLTRTVNPLKQLTEVINEKR